jgi:hypothetical protein
VTGDIIDLKVNLSTSRSITLIMDCYLYSLRLQPRVSANDAGSSTVKRTTKPLAASHPHLFCKMSYIDWKQRHGRSGSSSTCLFPFNTRIPWQISRIPNFLGKFVGGLFTSNLLHWLWKLPSPTASYFRLPVIEHIGDLSCQQTPVICGVYKDSPIFQVTWRR